MSTTQEIQAGQTVWALDPSHSVVEFSAKHMMITTVRGSFSDVKGTLVIDGASPDRSSVEAEIGVASIGTGVEQRDAHLRSPDFLDAEQFPYLTFESRRVEQTDASSGRIHGDLTIRGVTRPATTWTVRVSS